MAWTSCGLPVCKWPGVAPQKATAGETLRLSLERRGFVIEAGTVHECGRAVSARRREMNPVRKAA